MGTAGQGRDGQRGLGWAGLGGWARQGRVEGAGMSRTSLGWSEGKQGRAGWAEQGRAGLGWTGWTGEGGQDRTQWAETGGLGWMDGRRRGGWKAQGWDGMG